MNDDLMIDEVQEQDEQKFKFELGLHDGIPNDEYRRAPGVSKSGLDKLMRSPGHYKFYQKHPKPPTESLAFGNALHCMILEGEAVFNSRYCVVPHNAPRRPTPQQRNAKKPSAETVLAVKFWDQFKADNIGKEEISAKQGPAGPIWGMSDWDKIHRIRDSIMNHPIAGKLLIRGFPERSGWFIDPNTGRLCKFRLDFHNTDNEIIVDLKSTLDASLYQFSRSVVEYNYHVQDYFYRFGMQVLANPVQDFVFLCFEKEPPFAVACYYLTKEAKHHGMMRGERLMKRYAECKALEQEATDEQGKLAAWPLYPIDIRPMDIPAYGRIIREY